MSSIKNLVSDVILAVPGLVVWEGTHDVHRGIRRQMRPEFARLAASAWALRSARNGDVSVNEAARVAPTRLGLRDLRHRYFLRARLQFNRNLHQRLARHADAQRVPSRFHLNSATIVHGRHGTVRSDKLNGAPRLSVGRRELHESRLRCAACRRPREREGDQSDDAPRSVRHGIPLRMQPGRPLIRTRAPPASCRRRGPRPLPGSSSPRNRRRPRRPPKTPWRGSVVGPPD